MDTTEILVLIGGALSIAFVLWYFFGEREQFAAETNESGLQEVKVTIKGDLHGVVTAIALSKATIRSVKQNL
ncbi:MAG TPA: hypothetical protein VK308_02790, partial [Pyrinomonadaceae bacterium]|nr:hypothetical protein [Pyrinomonadaceae bacterium]